MSSLDDLAVYVFVRQDLSEQDQRLQFAHAVLEMACLYRPAHAKYRLVELDGGESEKAFRRTVRKMPERKVGHVIYSDPDHPEWGETAIATVPLTQDQALPLANYRLRRNSPVAQSQSNAEPTPDGAAEVGGADPSREERTRPICCS